MSTTWAGLDGIARGIVVPTQINTSIYGSVPFTYGSSDQDLVKIGVGILYEYLPLREHSWRDKWYSCQLAVAVGPSRLLRSTPSSGWMTESRTRRLQVAQPSRQVKWIVDLTYRS